MAIKMNDAQRDELIKRLELEPQPQEPPKPPQDNQSLISAFVTLDRLEEQDAEWLIPGWMPKGQIVALAANGGAGKTSIWCHIGAAISSGGTCLLDPQDYKRKPARVVFLTTEDSVRVKLRRKIRLAGADMSNIITPDFAKHPELFQQLKFGNPAIGEFVRYYRPALVIFDPIQGFVPPDANMCARNEMRNCLAPLTALGEETGTAFLLICHTNKRKGASGRDRISDSADLWDISRSVWMAGYSEDDDIRYLSNEKNNYAELQETVLFSIDHEGQIEAKGTTWKRDRDFMQDSLALARKAAPTREQCKEFIESAFIEAGSDVMVVGELTSKAVEAGFSEHTFRRAKEEMVREGRLKVFTKWDAEAKKSVWYAGLQI